LPLRRKLLKESPSSPSPRGFSVLTRISEIVAEVDQELLVKEEIREKVLELTRIAVRSSSQAINSAHNGDLTTARKHLEKAREAVHQVNSLVEQHPDLKYSGLLNQAHQEFTEASVFIALLEGKDVPSPSELGVMGVLYLTGLADVIGELRRLCVDCLRRDDFQGAERAFKLMEEIYSALRYVDHPKALIPGLRQKCDSARRMIEDTRGMLTMVLQRIKLRDSINTLIRKLEES